MRTWFSFALCGLIVGLFPPSADGQGPLGASINVGTLGVGGRVTLAIPGPIDLRGGLDLQPFSIKRGISGVNYDVKLPTPSISVLLDWHPVVGGFRLSGGLVYFKNTLELEASPLEDVDIGGVEYAPSEVGTLIGSLGTNRSAPYVGIGWGNSLGTISFSLDLGVAFHGPPNVALRATGPIGNVSTFLSRLDREIEEVTEDFEWVKGYPVLTVGLGF